MRPIFVSGFFSIVAVLTEFEQARALDHSKISDVEKERLAYVFETYKRDLQAMGLLGATASLDKLVGKFREEEALWSTVVPICAELKGRLIDETKTKKFFSLTPLESEYLENSRLGWELAIERFPDIVDDVEEARKCFALSRYPASVFHSVQIVEAGLIELGRFLKVNDPFSGWTSVASALQKVIDRGHKDRTPFERKNFSFLEQTQGTVAGLKNAWRNKISHSHGKLVVMTKEFNAEVSEEILMATRAFMRRLAEGLPPAKPKKGAV